MLRTSLAVLLSVSVLAACGRRDEEPPPDTQVTDAGTVPDAGDEQTPDAGETDGGVKPQLSLAEFCARAIEEVAERQSACLGGPIDGWLAEDPDFCPYLQAAVSAGRIRYNAANAEACIALLDNVPCAALESEFLHVDNACTRTFEGLVATEGECRDSLDCQLGNHCDESIYACPGTCVPFIPEGEECSRFSDDSMCVPGTSCVSGTCVKLATEGQACGDETADCAWGLNCTEGEAESTCVRNTTGACRYNEDCAPGYQCEGEDLETGPQAVLGTCALRKLTGSDCDAGEEECEPFNFCDPDTSKCVKYGTVGSACGWDSEFEGCIGSFCKEPIATEGAGEPIGVCTAYWKEGEACQWSGNGDECGKGGTCEWDPDDEDAASATCYVGCRTQTRPAPMPR